ncbi:Nn.00g026550.m01.CDS01 [Neocucurbitaria sp. VM-36]
MASLGSSIHRTLEVLVPKFHTYKSPSHQPIVLGITGLQGSGKSTWATGIVNVLYDQYNLRAITLSLDDLYKTHDDLIAQKDKDPANKLYQKRGQPGTHDEQLAAKFFSELQKWDGSTELKIPSFDKSKFNGEGDRAPICEWPRVQGKVDVIVFEGWCVGFQALSEDAVRSKHEAAAASGVDDGLESITTLSNHQLTHLQEMNQSLRRYNDTFMGPQHFDFLIHLDTDDLKNVYRWRLQQEHAMIKTKGSGMADNEVRAFVRGYMPGYELYLNELRRGFFGSGSGRQIRVVMGRERTVEKIDHV